MHIFTVTRISFLASFLLLLSCNSSPYEKDDLLGKWTVVNWEIEKTGQKRTNQMDMSYNADNSYVVDYGSEKELGEFWIANSYLHTKAENEAEKKVKIIKLNIDTLSIQMNRGGILENVLLVKEASNE